MSWYITLANSATAETNSDLWNTIDIPSGDDYVNGLLMSYNGGVDKAITGITEASPSIFSADLGVSVSNLDVNNRITFSGTSNPIRFTNALATLGSTFKISGVSSVGNYSLSYMDEDMLVDTCSVHALVFQPSILDESVEIKYWGGGLRKVKSCRIQFKMKIKSYQTRGDWSDAAHGQLNYWQLMKVLQGRNIFITSFGANFDRLESLSAKYLVEFVLPIAVEVVDFGELTPMFEDNADQLSVTLATKEWFTWA
jgi:hypothetical protein